MPFQETPHGVPRGRLYLARAAQWGVLGLFLSLGPGVLLRNLKKLSIGLIGGLIGGIEDRDDIDARRRAVGLGPIAWTRPPPSDEPPPADVGARRREMEAWARRVGWR